MAKKIFCKENILIKYLGKNVYSGKQGRRLAFYILSPETTFLLQFFICANSRI